MKLGYLHMGEPEHGVSRYGRILAAEAKRRPELHVIEAECVLARSGEAGLSAAAEALSICDVVHLQHSPGVWGGGWSQVGHLRNFLRVCSAPTVATLHDVYPGDTWRLWRSDRRSALRWLRGQRRELERGVPGRRCVRMLLERAPAVFVCSEQEADRVRAGSGKSMGMSDKVLRIDHFVEERGPLPSPAEARAALGLSDHRIVTLLGFIHPSKGHGVLLRAMRRLPHDVTVVFAGRASPGNEAYLASLLERARRDGTHERLVITGYLSHEDQERILVATDLAVAPFRYLSASGSLSTWISVAKPILASALPQIAEYEAMSPGAIASFEPYRPKALATAIVTQLAAPPEDATRAVAGLRDALLTPRIFDRHLEAYTRATQRG